MGSELTAGSAFKSHSARSLLAQTGPGTTGLPNAPRVHSCGTFASPPAFQPASLQVAGTVQHVPTVKARPGPRRPSMLSYMLASQIELLPTELTGPLPDLPVDELQAVIAAPQAGDAGRYTVCEPRQNVFHRNAGPHWSPQDYLADSASSVHYVVRQARFHRQPLPNLALPQVVLTPVWAEPGHQAVVVDLRPIEGGLCTVARRQLLCRLQVLLLRRDAISPTSWPPAF